MLNNSDPPELDAVELANFGDETTSIGGWLTDNLRVPRKYRILAGTKMEPGSFLVLDETDFGQSTEGNVGFFDSVRLAKKSICLPLPTASCKAMPMAFAFVRFRRAKPKGLGWEQTGNAIS